MRFASRRMPRPGWGATSLARRTQVLFAMRELVLRHRDDLAARITAEHGKVLSDAAGEVARGLESIEFACGISHLLKGGYCEQARRPASTCTRCASHSASSPASPRSTSRPWCRSGCARTRSRAATRSS